VLGDGVGWLEVGWGVVVVVVGEGSGVGWLSEVRKVGGAGLSSSSSSGVVGEGVGWSGGGR
jgi:hypothetical protein